MKVAVIGAGSTYTPELVSGLMRERDRVGASHLVLHDIDPQRLEVVGGLAARILERQGFPGALTLTDERDRALDAASTVIIQLRVGGQAARLRDETIPAACGCVGQETTGAGGLANAMRNVPVVLEVAERARELAADGAWIVDFTNPVGIVTRALLDEGHHAIGLCNVAITFQRRIAAHLGVAPERVRVDQVGLNHLTWIRAIWLDDGDVLGDVLSSFGDELAREIELPRRVLDELGAIPSYYLRYFYAEREVVVEQRTAPPRAQVVAEIERRLLEQYRDPSLSEKPPLLAQRGGAFYSEAAVQLVASITADTDDVQVVDIRNAGTLAGLAPDDVVELPARIGRHGAAALEQAPLAPELLGLVQHVAAYERLAADAARTGDRDLARLALMTNPLVRDWELADGLLDELLGLPAPTPARPAGRDGAGSAPQEVLLAVDGGNVKTDVALLDAGGRLLALVRGGASNSHFVGVSGFIGLLERLVAVAAQRAGLRAGAGFRVAAAQIMVAGADLPEELETLRAGIEALDWSERLVVGNDTFALLRSGTNRGWGVAVVCGGGVNCLGIAPDGRQVRYPSLGAFSGDWGGGYDVGLAALTAAARSADGRGPQTVLQTAVPAYYGLSDPVDVARAIHLRQMPRERLGELARVVFATAAGDRVAGGIVQRLIDEMIAFAAATLTRLDLTETDADVVLGGGLIRAAPAAVIERIDAGVRQVAPAANVLVAPVAPIVGAALLALDDLGVAAEVRAKASAALQEAFLEIEGDGARVLEPVS
jgi:6-phospho-beta-glucosidase